MKKIDMKYLERKNKIINDKYTEYVYEAFDIQNKEETSVKIPMNFSECKKFKWNIGVIYGGSGTGKTTLLKEFGSLTNDKFNEHKPLISNFDWLEPKEATFLLSAMGLASVPTWLRPFSLLSNGEQYRASLAYKVGKAKQGDTILIDEFTSVVDRDVAKAMSNALQKYIRRTNKKIILASCHFDIMEWLRPDWTYSPLKGRVEKHDFRLSKKPQIELQISRVESDTWNLFKKHHYLTEAVNKSCKFFLFEWNNKPIGICAVINQPRKGCPNGFALSRTVVLPDFQGMGLGTKISEFCASLFIGIGGKVYTKTVNPALGEYRNKSDKFRPTSQNGKVRKLKEDTDKKARNRLTRASYCHEYIGEGITGYTEILKPIKEMRESKSLTLF